ncbi:hypothetical protein O3G_MSEX005462 [Manduca sexta]|uniref:Uncharacterized protein n=1 Tax=Manduca sexta TaxID=7130 RepID=A0A921Z078_MANSE|nr:hypothetical protein O3G_MSEX005462 [Manduca sexta]
MFLIVACLLATAAAAPATYDQRQEGDFNLRADVENVLFVVAIPQKVNIPLDLLEDFMKTSKRHVNQPQIQERADVQLMEAFVEPSTPYQVEIGSGSRNAEGDGRAVEVVIAGRRRLDPEAHPEKDELKLLGATEQCGPDRERDPVTLTCRMRSQPEPGAEVEVEDNKEDDTIPSQPTPEVIPS